MVDCYAYLVLLCYTHTVLCFSFVKKMDKWLKRSRSGPSSSGSSSKVFKTSVSEGDEERVDGTPTESNATASVQPSSTSLSKNVKRKYDPTYLAFGFTYTGDENEPIPQCVVWMETLSKHIMKPSLLIRHFNTKHCNLKGKPVYILKLKRMKSKPQ